MAPFITVPMGDFFHRTLITQISNPAPGNYIVSASGDASANLADTGYACFILLGSVNWAGTQISAGPTHGIVPFAITGGVPDPDGLPIQLACDRVFGTDDGINQVTLGSLSAVQVDTLATG